MTYATLLKISRPRFWLYLAGPVAVAFAATNFQSSPLFVLFFIYCLLPANLLIYGVNDIFDRDTDALNDKKTGYEHRLKHGDAWYLVFWIIVLNVPFLLAFFFLLPPVSITWLCLFLLTGISYSTPPIRAKTKPFVDALCNILYVVPAFAFYTAAAGTPLTSSIIIAALCWCAAMHAYSAVPDIEPDKKAGLRTIATTLGAKPTIIVCALLYVVSLCFSFTYLGVFSLVAGAFYVFMMLLSLPVASTTKLLRLYKLFPALNSLLGMALWFWVVFGS